MNATATHNRHPRPPCGRFTWGRWLPRHPGPRAAAVLLATYALGFLLPVTGAIQSLVSGHHGGHGTTSTNSIAAGIVNDAIPLAVSLLAAVCGIRTTARKPLNLPAEDLGLRARPGITRARKSAAALIYAAVLILSVDLSVLILDAAHMHQDSATTPTDRLAAELVHSGWAGLLEEPILLGLTLGLATRLRWRWYVVVPLMIAMRIAFHLYYGAGALFVVFWMAAAYVLYRYCPVVWPFIVGHGIFDVLQTMSDGSSARATTFNVVEALVAIAGAALAAAVIVANRRNRDLEPPAATALTN